MSEQEYSAEYQRTLKRRAQFKCDMEIALVDQNNRLDHPLPWTAAMVVHDGPGIQLFDANGKPVLAELLRDPQDAAQLIWSINSASGQ